MFTFLAILLFFHIINRYLNHLLKIKDSYDYFPKKKKTVKKQTLASFLVQALKWLINTFLKHTIKHTQKSKYYAGEVKHCHS